MLKGRDDERRYALPYIHGAVGNVGGAHVDWCIVEIFSAREHAHGTSP